MIAIFPSLGWQEMFLLLIIGLLLYGRNLPDAGRSLGRVVAQLKRSFHDFKDQLDRDGQIGDVKKALKDTADEMKNIAKVPRALSNPKNALLDLTHQAMSSAIDEPDIDEPGDVEMAVDQSGDSASQDDADESSATEPESADGPGEDVDRDESSTPPTETGA